MREDPRRDELLEDLDSDGNSYFSGGFWNNIIDLSLTVCTVFASLIASGLAVAHSERVRPWQIAIIAGIPAAAASIQKIVGVRERSNWYFMYAAQVRSLATRLRFATPTVEEIANERAKLEIKMEADWTKLGSSVGMRRITKGAGS